MTEVPTLLLGIDGGGTKTTAWLGQIAGDGSPGFSVIGRATSGGSNPRAAGFETAFHNISQAIADAFRAGRVPAASVQTACFSIAGAGRPEEQQRIREWAEKNCISKQALVAGDAEIVLAAAEEDDNLHDAPPTGVSLIAGTGSMAWGCNAWLETARAGGWGYLFGDEGSAFALAVAALRAASQAADKRAEPTSLTDALLQSLGLNSPSELIPWCYGQASPRQAIAALAPIVFAESATDECAGRIIRAGARDLACMVRAVVHKLDFTPNNYTLALAGGVVCRQESYANLLQHELDSFNIAPRSCRFVEHPVLGALRLAHRKARSNAAANGSA